MVHSFRQYQWCGVSFFKVTVEKQFFFSLKQVYVVKVILSELLPKYWANVLLPNRHICYLYHLPVLQFGCLQLFPVISPVVLQGGENWGWPDLISFILFNQQKKYKEKSLSIHTIEEQWDLPERKAGTERWAQRIRWQPICGHGFLGRAPDQ